MQSTVNCQFYEILLNAEADNILGVMQQTSGIRINPEIRIQIRAHFRLTIRPWQCLRSLSALVVYLSLLYFNYRIRPDEQTQL